MNPWLRPFPLASPFENDKSFEEPDVPFATSLRRAALLLFATVGPVVVAPVLAVDSWKPWWTIEATFGEGERVNRRFRGDGEGDVAFWVVGDGLPPVVSEP